MAAKTITGFIWAPLWARCAVAYNKRRLVLVFSLVMMGAMYMSFTAVYYKVGNLQMCQPFTNHDQTDGNATSVLLNSTSVNLSSSNKTGSETIKEQSTVSSPSNETSMLPTVNPNTVDGEMSPSHLGNISELERPPYTGDDIENPPAQDTAQSTPHPSPPLPVEKLEGHPESTSNQRDVRNSAHRFARTLNFTFLNNLKNEVGLLTTTLEEKQLLLFLVVLLVVIFGEFFCSPVEKIADDAWFDFLERIDDMEKYGRQRYWGSLTFALVPIIVTAMVDYTPCRMMMNLHHFLLHFFVFGIFIILTIFLAFYFPMPPPVKQKYSSKVGKGLRVICCDGRGFLFVITLLLAGIVYASFNNFLFWHLYELGSSEITMGLCVSIAAFAETPMLIFSNKLVRKLGNGGVVSLSLFVLALRVLYYGFLWTPWAVLPAEITNAFTHTALWYAVLSYDEFNVGSAMDRSIRSILSSIYFGLGFSVGSFLSGVVYHVYGPSVLFWAASVLSGGWCLVYSLIQCCLPKKERVKYIKLLRKEDDDSSDGDDDWLEMALKDQ